MSRELCHQQEALWELLTTELVYVRKLKIMTDVSPSAPALAPPQPFARLPPALSPFSQTRRAGLLGDGATGYREMPLIRALGILGERLAALKLGVGMP